MAEPKTTATIYVKDRDILEQLRIDYMHKTRKFINQQDFFHLVIATAKR